MAALQEEQYALALRDEHHIWHWTLVDVTDVKPKSMTIQFTTTTTLFPGQKSKMKLEHDTTGRTHCICLDGSYRFTHMNIVSKIPEQIRDQMNSVSIRKSLDRVLTSRVRVGAIVDHIFKFAFAEIVTITSIFPECICGDYGHDRDWHEDRIKEKERHDHDEEHERFKNRFYHQAYLANPWAFNG